PKPPARHSIVGRSQQRLDIPAKVTGIGTAFVHDLRLPGMMHGRVVRPPRYGSILESYNEGVKSMPGVVAVVREGSFLGVVAAREEEAIKARTALAASARWTGGPQLPDPARIYDHLMSLKTQDAVIGEKTAP